MVVTNTLLPKSGISAPVVTSIPDQWSAAWFRRFITNYLQNADVRNTPGIVGATFANPPTSAVIASAVAVFTATTSGTVPASGGGSVNVLYANGIWAPPLAATIPNDTVLGNVSGSAASATALNTAQLTTLVNTFTSTLSGAVPASGSGTAVDFLNAIGAFVVPPIFATTTPGYVPAPGAITGKFLSDSGAWSTVTVPTSANPSAQVGPTAVNGTATTFMTSDSAPSLNVGANYTWGGSHIFNALLSAAAGLTVSGAAFTSRGILDNGLTNALTIANTQTITTTAPSSGTSLTVNGNNSAIAAIVASGLSAGTGGADLKVTRAGSTINTAAEGPNLFLDDTTNVVGYYLQVSGGQFEIWSSVGAGPTLTQILKVPTTGGMIIDAPTGGSGLDVGSVVGGPAITFSAAGAYTASAINKGVLYYDSTNGNLTIASRSNGGNTGIRFNTSNGGTDAIRMTLSNLGGLAINAPVSGDTLTVAPSATSGALVATSAALTNNAGASSATLTNAPAAGNPTKWIKINDNGTIRSIPSW